MGVLSSARKGGRAAGQRQCRLRIESFQGLVQTDLTSPVQPHKQSDRAARRQPGQKTDCRFSAEIAPSHHAAYRAQRNEKSAASRFARSVRHHCPLAVCTAPRQHFFMVTLRFTLPITPGVREVPYQQAVACSQAQFGFRSAGAKLPLRRRPGVHRRCSGTAEPVR